MSCRLPSVDGTVKDVKARRVSLILAPFIMLCLPCVGCGHVRPHEREDLARIEKELGRADATRGYAAHMWSVREGTGGGDGNAGGGCGCN